MRVTALQSSSGGVSLNMGTPEGKYTFDADRLVACDRAWHVTNLTKEHHAAN